MTIADQLTSIANTKAAIKTAIEAKGQTVGAAAFDQYPAKIAAITGGGSGVTPEPWVRPSDWLELPTIGPTEQKFVGLLAITNDDSNFIAVLCNGSYTVDWGDGSATENIAAGVKAQHQYDYSTISDLTLCSRGYKQVIVTVTPQAGQNLTTVNLSQKHTLNTSTNTANQWLDIAVGSPYLSSLNIGSSSDISGYLNKMIEQVKIASWSSSFSPFMNNTFQYLTSLRSVSWPSSPALGGVAFYNMLRGCSALTEIPWIDTSNATTFLSMFEGCSSLVSIPALNTANGTSFKTMFNGCRSLKSVPSLNTALGTDFTGMFQNCVSLDQVPELNTSNGTAFGSMFYGCSSLQAVPLIDTAKGTNFSAMFQNCYALQSVPALNTGLGTDFSNFINSCLAIQTFPQLNTSNGTAFTGMFQGCQNLKAIPALDTAKATGIASMFYNCLLLTELPIYNTSLCTNFGNAFYQCVSLRTIPAISFAADTSNALTNTFASCYNLSSVKATGIGLTFSVANCKLSAAALNEIYTNLPTVTGKTITVTGNWGTATDNPSIATAKGWTVTG